MTAPVAPTTPATPPTEPVRPGPDTPSSPTVFSPTRNSEADRQINDTSDAEFAKLMGIEDFATPASPPASPAKTEPAPDLKVDRDGNVHGPDGKFRPKAKAGEEPAPGDATAPPAATEPAPATPAAEPPAAVAEPAPAEPPKPAYTLATEFRVADEDGDLDVADTAQRLKLTFKADGQEHKDVPLDKVVRYAQRGFYNERQQMEVQQARIESARLQQEMTNAKALLEENQRWFADALADAERLMAVVPPEQQTGFLARALRNYAQMNSPEMVAQRERDQLTRERQAFQQQVETQQVQQFVQTTLTPALERAVQQHPTVTFEEAFGRFNILLTPFLVNGRVPVAKLPDVLAKVEEELVPWVESAHQTRQQQQQQQTQRSQAATTAAQTAATLAKRQLARAVAPSPAAAPPLRETPKPRTFKSAREATEAFDPTVDVG